MADPYYNSVTLLLHGNGANGSTHFVDDSALGLGVAATGAVISSSQSKFGGASMYFDGTAGFAQVLDNPDSRQALLFPGDFTVEFQVRAAALVNGVILGAHAGAYIGTTSAGAIVIVGAGGTVTSSAGAVGAGAFKHIAISRTGSTLRIFSGGAEVASVANSGEFGYAANATYPHYLGKLSQADSPALQMHLSELRVTKGVGRYTSAFTPPAAAFDPQHVAQAGGAYRHWRLNINASANAAGASQATPAVASLEMRESALGSNVAVAGNGSPYASSTQGAGWEAARAFDANTSTAWYGLAGGPHALRWDFGQGGDKAISHLTLVNSAALDAAASGATFEYSDDAASWAVLMSFTRSSALGASSTHIYTPPGFGTANLSAPAATAVGFAGGWAGLAAPTPLCAGFGGANASLYLPAPRLFAHGGGWAHLAAPRATLLAAGHDSTGERAANLTAPRPTLSAFGGANAQLVGPVPLLAAVGTGTGWGSAALAAPAATLAASGTVSSMASAALTAPMASLIGYSGAVCSITLTGKATLAASGTTGAVGSAALTCPLFALTASGTAQNHGSANLLAPAARLGATAQAWLIAPAGRLTAIGSAVVTATYEAYAINLNHNDPATNDEVTRYTNFPFTKIVRYQGSYFGVAAGGLYLLEGTTDNGAVIPWSFKTAMTDFKSPFRKTVVSTYFGGRLGTAATIDLHVGEDGATAYNYSTVRSDHAQCYRQKFGRGLTAHYYALGVAGTGTLELDNIEFENLDSIRRI